MILSTLDLGGRPAHLVSSGGQAIQATQVVRKAAAAFSGGGTLRKLDIDGWVEAWQALGGQAAGSLAALRLLRQQLEELRENPELQPVYLQAALTAQTGPVYTSRTDSHDGWYLVDALTIDMETYNGRGAAELKGTLTHVGPATPAALALAYAGAALSSSYSATATPLIAYPVGATGQPATTGSRTGGEGVIPLSTLSLTGINPAPFSPPATIAGLFTGGVRVWDTISTASNPVPVAGGTFVNANWVEVFGTQHDFAGDMVVTNGLQLHLYVVGSAPCPLVYMWNTTLGTPTWQSIGSVQYQDNAGNAGTLRSYDIDRLGLQEVRVRARLNTSAGNWALLKTKLQAGRYDTYLEFWPQTQANTNQLGLLWSSTAVYATGLTDTTTSTTFPSNLATTSVSGYAAAQGSASGSPLFGWLYQVTPTTAQGRLSTTSVFGFGDTGGPGLGSMRLYGFFVAPYSGAVVTATSRGIVAAIFTQWLFDRSVAWVRG